MPVCRGLEKPVTASADVHNDRDRTTARAHVKIPPACVDTAIAALSVSVQRLPSAFIPPRLVMYLWGLKQSALVIHKICMSRAMTAPTPLGRERYPARLLQSFCRQRRSSLNQTGD